MSDNLTALYLQNPQLAQALRRQQYGQQMAQSATSFEPIASPWQGAAKLASATIGALLMSKSDKEFQKAMDDQSKDREAWRESVAQLNSPMSADQHAQQPAMGPSMPAGGGDGAVPPPELMPHFQEASARTGIPVPVLVAQAKQESNFNPNAVGRSGEQGVMQVMPSTARDPGFGVPPVDPAALKDPRTNINFGADYLKARAGNVDWANPDQRGAAYRAYNGGGDPNYVANVSRNLPPDMQQGQQVAFTGQPSGAQPPAIQAPPSTARLDAEEAQARRAMVVAANGMNTLDPRVSSQAKLIYQGAQHTLDRIQTERARMSTQAEAQAARLDAQREARLNRVPQRTEITDEKTGKVYEHLINSDGTLGARLGLSGKVGIAEAGKPTTETRVTVGGENEANKLTIQNWINQQQKTATNRSTEGMLQQFETAMDGFKTGAAADLRLKGQQILAEMGFPNAASQGEAMQHIQYVLQIAAAKAVQGQGQISNYERESIENTAKLFGNTPEGAKLVMDSIRSLHRYDRQLHDVYQSSAERNKKENGMGFPDPIEVGKRIGELDPPISPSLISRMDRLRQSAGLPPTAPAAGGSQPAASPVASSKPPDMLYVPGKGFVPQGGSAPQVAPPQATPQRPGATGAW